MKIKITIQNAVEQYLKGNVKLVTCMTLFEINEYEMRLMVNKHMKTKMVTILDENYLYNLRMEEVLLKANNETLNHLKQLI